jgi:hypothetical protein
MQLMVFLGQRGTGTSTVQPQRVQQRQPVEPPVTEDDESMRPVESDSSDTDEDNNDSWLNMINAMILVLNYVL